MDVASELIGLLAIQDMPETGLQELVLSDWRDISEPLDSTVFAMLFSKCSNLTNLTITEMDRLNAKTRMALAQQVASVLTQSAALETVNLQAFSQLFDEGEGEVILSALSNCASEQLTSFDCSMNETWFCDA